MRRIDSTTSNTVLFKELFRVALPIMAANLLQSLYNLADTYFLGSLGSEAVSAPSITNNITNFLIVFGTGFSLAGTTMISQIYGKTRAKGDKLDHLASQVFIINIFMSVVVLTLGTRITPFLCRLMQVPSGKTLTYTTEYMRLSFIGMPFMFMDQIFRATLQGLGDSVTPLIVQAITVFLNFVLDPIFIFGLGLEVRGAAYATNIARFISAFIGMAILFSGKKGIRVRFSYMKPAWPVLRKIFSIGFPSAIGQAISNLGFAVIQGVVNTFGPAVIAGYGVGNKITNFFMLPAMGINNGVQVTAARRLGEERVDLATRIVKLAFISAALFVGIGMGICMVFGHQVMRFFVDDDEVIFYGVQFFRVVTFSIIVFALYMVISGAFNAGGQTKYTMLSNIIRLWCVRVPFAVILPRFMGTYGLWTSMLLSNVIAFLILLGPFILGKWKRTIDIPQLDD